MVRILERAPAGRRWPSARLTVMALVLLTWPALAQAPSATQPPATQPPATEKPAAQTPAGDASVEQKVQEILRLLSDPQLRAALAAAAPDSAAVDDTAQATLEIESALDLWVAQIKAHVWTVLQATMNLHQDVALALQAAESMIDRAGWLRLLLSVAVVLACAFAAETAFRRLLARGEAAAARHRAREAVAGVPDATIEPPQSAETDIPAPVQPAAPASDLRPEEKVASDGLPLFAFVLTVVVVYLLLRWPAPLGPLVQPWLIALMLVRVTRWIVRLSFRLPDASVLPGAGEFWLRRYTQFAAIFAIGWALSRSLTLLGGPVETVVLLRYITGAMLIVLTIATLWHHPTTPERRATLASRRLLLTAWLVMIAVLEVLGTVLLFWLAVYIVALPPLLRQVTRLVRGVMAPAGSSKSASLRLVLVDRGMRAVVIAAAALWLAWLVRHHPTRVMMGEDVLATVLQGLLRGVIILLLADLGWQALKAAVETSLQRAVETSDPAALARSARMRTLLPIIRSIAGVAILTVALMMVLAGLGVEIGPLIAGAGVFGVAIGFGSQTLVKDVLSGVFYMLDDAFRVGEYIQSGNYKGVVEGFSLRSVRLRHHRGPVFTVPFGSLGAVQNMSRDWSKDKFLLTVPYDTDIEKVRKLVKKVGETLLADEEIGPLFIQPIKMKGVERFGDYGITLGVAMILQPTPLLSMIRRRAYMMIRDAFRQNGIEFASPTIQVAAHGGEEDKAAERAAAVALEQRRRAEAAREPDG